MKLRKILLVLAILVCAPAFLLVGCGHEHEYSETLKVNETHHWYECECGEKKDEAEHVFNKQVQDEAYLKESTDTQLVYYKSCECGAKASDTETFAINKVVPTLEDVTMSSVAITYLDNYSVNYTTNSTGTVKIEYKAQGDSNNSYTTNKPTDAGDYTARVTVLANETYAKVQSDPINFTIEKYTLTGLSANVVYNGNSTHVLEFDELEPGQYEPGLALSVTFNGADVGSTPTNVTVKLNGATTHNYIVDTSTCTVNITPKELGLTWQPNDTPFAFNGEETTPQATLTGVVQGDDCSVEIGRSSGDNTWFDETFVFEALSLSGADAGNYELPEAKSSPVYSISIREKAVGDEEHVGLIDYGETEYFKISLDAGYYAFKYESGEQGVEYHFQIFKKGETTAIADEVYDEYAEGETVFIIEEDGDYYVKYSLTEDCVPQYETLQIVAHTCTTLDDYGHCTKCGVYQGETEDMNAFTTVTFDGPETLYYRFKLNKDADYMYNILFSSGEFNYTAYAVLFAGEDYDADVDKYNNVEVLALTTTATEFPACDYIYLKITQKGTTESVIFQIEETLA